MGGYSAVQDQGLDVSYLMLAASSCGRSEPGPVDYYVQLFKKIRETADWKAFIEQGASIPPL